MTTKDLEHQFVPLTHMLCVPRSVKDDASKAITCGSYVKITNVDTGFDLSSEPKSLGSGSGQQIVTFQRDPGTHNTLWWIRPRE